MSIELLTNEHMGSFKNALKNTKKSIKIISPFIGINTSKIIANFIKENVDCECIVITRFYTQDFLEGVSSLDGLKLLNESNVRLYALKDLHSKLYLIDDDYGIVGSANFTMGGFKTNHELSLAIEYESELLKQLNNYFDELEKNINDNGNWIISLEKIKMEIELIDKLLKNRKNKNVKFSNNKKWGANISNKDFETTENDFIENYLKEDLVLSDEIAWIKFEGSSRDRFDNGYRYLPYKLKSKNIYITSFPRNPRSIESKNTIFLSAVSYDNKGNAIPIIVGRAKSYGYCVDNIVTDDDKEEVEWLDKYQYYVELYDIEIIDTEIVNGISLNSLVMQLRTDLYPNTVGKNINQQDILNRHYQKSHISITPMAKNFLDDKLDILLKQYGKIILS